MGDTRTVESMAGGEGSIGAWSNIGAWSKTKPPPAAHAVTSSCCSISAENQDQLTGRQDQLTGRQDQLTGRGAVNWCGETKDFRCRNPEEGPEADSAGFPSDSRTLGAFCRGPGPSASLLATLQSLAEHGDHMLLPHSLHQIAESYFLEEDYPWAVQFLRLEQLYHERLLANLASLQEEWESQSKAVTLSSTPVKMQCHDAESKCIDSLSQICQTHQRPNRTMEKDVVDVTSRTRPVEEERSTVQETPTGDPSLREEKENDSSSLHSKPQGEREDKVKKLEEELEEELEEDLDEDLEEDLEEVSEDDGLMDELQEDLTEGCLVFGEELVKLIPAEQSFPSKGLVSILKKSASQDGIDDHSLPKGSGKRKVRFSETDDTLDNEEVGGASCLLFFLLCLVTVVISMGGTALFCLLGGAYSNVCTDFSQNVDFYFGPVRRGMDTLTHWFMPTPPSSPC